MSIRLRPPLRPLRIAPGALAKRTAALSWMPAASLEPVGFCGAARVVTGCARSGLVDERGVVIGALVAWKFW